MGTMLLRHFQKIQAGLLLCFVLVSFAGCSDDNGSSSSTSPSTNGSQATLHALICAADVDSSLGSGSVKDRDIINQWADTISQQTGMALNKLMFTESGSNLTESALMDAINSLSVSSDDVIMFYYSGHGGANERSGGTKWPVMKFMNDALVDLYEVNNKITSQGARLTIVLADCCNNFSNQAKVIRSNTIRGSSQGYQKLFLQQRGSILASGASQGEFSIGEDGAGGLFTKQFFESFDETVSSSNPSWNTVMQRSIRPITISDPLNTQTPQCDINVSDV